MFNNFDSSSLFSFMITTPNKKFYKADPVQTKHQLFKTKPFLQRAHAME